MSAAAASIDPAAEDTWLIDHAVRARLQSENGLPAGAGWEIVINPRLRALTAPFPQVEREIERLLERCVN